MRTPEEIDETIRQRHREGSRPCDIAQFVNRPTSFVRERLDAMGFKHEDGSHENLYRVNPIWDADPDKRREAVWRRQRDAASAALRRIEQ